jgi:hypothetical protein
MRIRELAMTRSRFGYLRTKRRSDLLGAMCDARRGAGAKLPVPLAVGKARLWLDRHPDADT